jgi:ABC-type transport system involved in multi-copper enzyme maturation permease subunit
MVILLAGGAFAPTFAAPGPTGPNAPTASSPGSLHIAISYEYSEGYQFTFVAYYDLGSAAPGTQVSLQVSSANSTGARLASLAGVTNDQGLLGLSWGALPCKCTASVNATATDGSGIILETTLQDPPPPELAPLSGAISVIHRGWFVAVPSLVVAFVNQSGSVPAGTLLTYCVLNSSSSSGYPCTTHSLGPVTSNLQIFTTEQFASLSGTDTIIANLTDPDGVVLETEQIPSYALNPSTALETASGANLVGRVETMSLLVGFAAVLVGFVTYGRERLTGSLDSVLALPTTRTRILLARYFSALVPVVAATVIGVTLLSISLSRVTEATLPLQIWLSLVAAFAAEGIAFVGLTFLGAHLVRSSSLLLVASFLVMLAFTILWVSVIAAAAGALRIPASIGSPLSQSVYAPFSPAQTSISVVGLEVLKLDGGGPYLLPAIGSGLEIVAMLLAWITLPIVLAVFLFRFRD